MLITRWYVEQPDKRIELEVNYVPNLGFVVEGHIHIYHTNEDGTRGALRARIPFGGNSPGTPITGADGSHQGTVGRYPGGSSGGSAGSDTDGASSEIARAITSGLEVNSEPGRGPRTRRVPRANWRPPNRS